jgi:hypothetical protein
VTTYVRQRCATDCGVAAVAMLAGVSYEAAMKALFPSVSPRRKTFRTSYHCIRRGVATVGTEGVFFTTSCRRFRSWDDLAGKRGILRIVWTGETRRRAGHWIVFDGTEVKGMPLLYDPAGTVFGKDDLPGGWRPVSFQALRAPRRK